MEETRLEPVKLWFCLYSVKGIFFFNLFRFVIVNSFQEIKLFLPSGLKLEHDELERFFFIDTKLVSVVRFWILDVFNRWRHWWLEIANWGCFFWGLKKQLCGYDQKLGKFSESQSSDFFIYLRHSLFYSTRWGWGMMCRNCREEGQGRPEAIISSQIRFVLFRVT